MSTDNLFNRIILRLGLGGRKSPPEPRAPRNDPALARLLRMLQHTHEAEIPCDEVFELLDQYAELVARNEDAAALLPLVQDHLDRCRDCREEYEALARIIAASTESN